MILQYPLFFTLVPSARKALCKKTRTVQLSGKSEGVSSMSKMATLLLGAAEVSVEASPLGPLTVWCPRR
jgi:hypothetical protein